MGGGRRRVEEVVGVGEDGLPVPPSSFPEFGRSLLSPPFPRCCRRQQPSSARAVLARFVSDVLCVEEKALALCLVTIGCQWMVDLRPRVTLCPVTVGAPDLSPSGASLFGALLLYSMAHLCSEAPCTASNPTARCFFSSAINLNTIYQS
jgi:hypothetical protein